MVHGLRKRGLLRILVVSSVSHMSCAHLLSIKSHHKITQRNILQTTHFGGLASCTPNTECRNLFCPLPLNQLHSRPLPVWTRLLLHTMTRSTWRLHYQSANLLLQPHLTHQPKPTGRTAQEWREVRPGAQAAHWNQGQVQGLHPTELESM